MSVEIRIRYEGMEGLQQTFQRLDSAMKRNVQKRLAKLARIIKRTAQQLAPVKTGYLRSTIFAEAETWTVKVGATASYAVFVELGTRFMRARRFLTRAVEMHGLQLPSLLGDAVQEAIMEAAA